MERNESKGRRMKDLYVKGILMATALLLLVAALVFLTTAWYTKMVSMASVNMTAAKWEFTANHTVDAVSVNVWKYGSVAEEKAAPGTAGYIPVVLGAQQSQTSIQFSLSVDRGSMGEEFQKRIFFYFYEDRNKDGTEEKYYFDISPAEYHAGTKREPETMKGEIPKDGEKTVYVHWEWLYEHPNANDQNKTAELVQEIEAWDYYDTLVGAAPERFEPYMNATITVVGVEVNPETTKLPG